jgi:hypothetical protein
MLFERVMTFPSEDLIYQRIRELHNILIIYMLPSSRGRPFENYTESPRIVHNTTGKTRESMRLSHFSALKQKEDIVIVNHVLN